MKNAEKTIGDLIAKCKTSFIASIDDDGFPNMKAMLMPRERNGIKTFLFSTNTSSERVAQFRKNPKASIYFYRKGLTAWQGAMLRGTMEILEDEESKKRIWQKGDTVYYPQGVSDPDYCVLKFTAFSGRYYRAGLGGFEIESFDVK